MHGIVLFLIRMIRHARFNAFDHHLRHRAGFLLAQPVMIESNIHRRHIRRPDPKRHLRRIRVRVTDIQLRRVQFPEITHAECYATGSTANITQPRGATTLISRNPAMPVFGTLANRKTIGIRLVQCKVTPGGHPVNPGADDIGPIMNIRHLFPGKLSCANIFPGVTHPRQPLYCFGP